MVFGLTFFETKKIHRSPIGFSATSTKNIFPELTIEVKRLEATKNTFFLEPTIKNDGLEAKKHFLPELTIKVDSGKATKRIFAYSDSDRDTKTTNNKLSEIRIAKLKKTKIILSASNDKKFKPNKYNFPEQDKSHRLKCKNI